MNRISTPPRWPNALLGLLLAGSTLLPALAAQQDLQDRQDRRAERWQRRTQSNTPQAEAVAPAPLATPIPMPPPAPRITPQPSVESGISPPHRFEPRIAQPRPVQLPLPATTLSAPDGDSERRENWGQLARQQLERQREQRQERFGERAGRSIDTPPTADSLPRPRFEHPQPEPGLPTVERGGRADWQRRPRAPDSERPEAASPQADVIARAREQEAQRQREQDRRDDGRPDWRGDDGRGRDREWREDRRDRVSPEQQRERFEAARRQQAQWQREEDRRRNEYERQRHDLERQRRHAQYRYQQDYWRRWLAAQARWDAYRFDVRDPYFYTPYNYRYGYDGRWYSTNRYGAELLRQAVRDGYREGWYAGRADRADRWRFDYRANYAWIDGSYGYYGPYVALSDYRYYFRQGFERGYSDGYYGRYQYGRYESGDAMILPALLGLILAFTID